MSYWSNFRPRTSHVSIVDSHRHHMQQLRFTALSSLQRREIANNAATDREIESRRTTSVALAMSTYASGSAFAHIMQTCDHALLIHVIIIIQRFCMQVGDLVKTGRACTGSLPPTKG